MTLIEIVASKTNLKKSEVKKVIEALKETIIEKVSSGEKPKIHAFGTFRMIETKPREQKSYFTGEVIKIPAKKRVRFKAAKNLDRTLNNE